jgi:hypothetical protein
LLISWDYHWSEKAELVLQNDILANLGIEGLIYVKASLWLDALTV